MTLHNDPAPVGTGQQPSLPNQFKKIRIRTIELCAGLEPEDYVVQSMADASPAKWHLAHTTWFFENFILAERLPEYRRFNADYHHLFNSYYYSAGEMYPRPRRGLLSRPLLNEVLAYRDYVDEHMLELIARGSDGRLQQLVTLGLQHEQQHQELLLTDIKHMFSCNPMKPALNEKLRTAPTITAAEHVFIEQPGGIFEIGADQNGFCFDNETPRHRVLLQDYAIGSRLVTNGEFREFIRDGGYAQVGLWLSDGWTAAARHDWKRPLYWGEDLESEFTLGGQRDLAVHAPVTHLSYYEADAYARWAEARLPGEAEWECAARQHAVRGNLAEAGHWHPVPARSGQNQFFGDVWEWTASPYAPYPGFKPLSGSLGEYNGKFMCNQMTVRGGSCVTAEAHIRASYRSFFYPDARWQFLGIRLARDAG